MPVMQQPEAYWGNAGTFFNAEGKLINEKTRAVMQRFIQAYAGWTEKILA
jgi:chromate reductase